jgi:hypothetical protein
MESWLVRTIRRRRFDRNPLRQPSDRAETLVCLWLFVFFAVFAPLAARSAGGGVSTLGEHMKSVALATRHEPAGRRGGPDVGGCDRHQSPGAGLELSQ